MSDEKSIATRQLAAAIELRRAVDAMSFSAPAGRVYDPLDYAWAPFERYVGKYGDHRARAIFLGMNPGPWGMAQTGVPFGEVSAVKNWLGICEPVARPANEHPKRRIDGFACTRSEVSGKRLWGLFADRFGTAERFFAEHFVVNYCPLLFIGGDDETAARNVTPDKLAPREREALYVACDEHLREVVAALDPEFVVGVGAFAAKRAEIALTNVGLRARRVPKVVKILHPSPASPASNASPWGETAASELVRAGVWS